MSNCVCSGARLSCPFASSLGQLIVYEPRVMGNNAPLANIMDNKPFSNIQPFGMCSSMANPTVAAATTAALGVLTPMPCVPMLTGLWMSGNTGVLVRGYPVLTDKDVHMCMYGGIIKIEKSNCTNITVGGK